jgi:16S rRNA pseudouridine516 synthase
MSTPSNNDFVIQQNNLQMLRLDRYLSNATALTRSQAQRAIRGGRVSVDGAVVKQAARAVPLNAEVCLEGARIEPPLPRYFMLHKPQGVVCATEDPSHRTAIDLLDVPNPAGLHFAGRLDIDTTGLVLISDDGEWTHRITSPGRRCAKRYRVQLAERVGDSEVQRLREGVMLRSENRPTRPAEVERLGERELLLSIQEGRYHQVKRMLAALGQRVVGLHREAIGPLELDVRLPEGAYRALSEEEVALF